MAEQILEKPQVEQSSLLEGSRQEFGQQILPRSSRAQERLPERTLDIASQSGRGPHVSTGRNVKREVDTAGKLNRLTHGAQGPGPTSGQAKRGNLMLARQARQEPRDALSYREEFGTTMTDQGLAAAQESEKQFGEYTQEIRGLIGQERAAVTQGRGQVKSEWQNYQSAAQAELNKAFSQLDSQRNSAYSQLDKQYQQAMGSLGAKQSIDSAYRTWYNDKSSTSPMWLYTGSMSNPGKLEATYRGTNQQLGTIFGALAKGGYTVVNNRVYLNGRGQEVHDIGRRMETQNKNDFYKTQGGAVSKHNAMIDQAAKTYQAQLQAGRAQVDAQYNTARGDVQSQFNQAFGETQRQYSDAMAALAKREGAALGREQGLDKEIDARQQDLADIRQSYNDRIDSINKALQFNVERAAQSRSEAQPQQERLDPRMPGAQQ